MPLAQTSFIELNESRRRNPSTYRRKMWPHEYKGAMVFAWLLILHVTAVIGLVICPLPGWRVFIASVTLLFLGGLGATLAYHRAIAHRSMTLNPVVQSILIFFAMLTGVTPPRAWIPNHRYHHAKTDSPEDPSSPAWYGLWTAHLAWYWLPSTPVPAKYSADLGGFSLRVWDYLMAPILLLAFFGGALLGLREFFWLGAIRLAFTIHANSLVNSVCHTGFDTPGEDSSRNVWWVGFPILMLGENWHRNHHSSPSSARIGRSWRQPDVGYLLVLLLERMGLATGVRHPV